ncbi:DegT/DnrJ/EryC1/StrS family aminotransferase [Bradyrhizobium jicamae]|uniref:DegT/DnrJ/EryC1/StrS family aminotransferase n=1 Tax=Bradyrhizobium jicamae TaxID=280332 RepID=UPI001BA5C8D0|nr:DegT/DnrJ/EryC1/StrS family aminotransferase [Bradyrhizobium jicamae]
MAASRGVAANGSTHRLRPRALLTHSCSSALDMTALPLDIADGDEIMMPLDTFVSTANAFAARLSSPTFERKRSTWMKHVETAVTPRIRTSGYIVLVCLPD